MIKMSGNSRKKNGWDKRLQILLIGIFALFPSCVLQPQDVIKDSNVGPISINQDHLKTLKDALAKGDSTLIPAYENLIDRAEGYLDAGPYSVTHKKFTPPSGSKHDYMTIATYWWPNPDTESGLPYVNRDGQTNPEVKEYDRIPLNNLSNSTFTLALAYYYSGNNRYAQKASELIKTWFLEEQTHMNPHLKFAQAIPGISDGGSHGIIETRDFIKILDAVGLIYESSYWDKKDQLKLKIWFKNYLSWLLNSSKGRAEADSPSNHGMWYDTQVATFAIFTEENNVARNILKKSFYNRLRNQLNSQGALEAELNRRRSKYYAWFNLKAILSLVYLRDKIDTNENRTQGFQTSITNQTTSPQVTDALDWLLPYVEGEKEWGYVQVTDFNNCKYLELYRAAAIQFKNPKYANIANKVRVNGCKDDTSLLIYPPLKD